MFCPKCGTENPEEGKYCRKCGTDLSGVARAIGGGDPGGLEMIDPSSWGTDAGMSGLDPSQYGSSGGKKKRHSGNSDDLLAAGIRSTLFGIGFLIISMALLFTNVANGHTWWWAMLFPGFGMIAGGVGNIAKSRRLEKRFQNNSASGPVRGIRGKADNEALPAGNTKFIPAERPAAFETGDLVPPSVVEQTTKHLSMDTEGETMTLPDVKNTD